MATSKKQKDSKIKARSKKADDKQKNILEMLKSHGAKIYEDLDNGQFPKFSIPSRSVCSDPEAIAVKLFVAISGVT